MPMIEYRDRDTGKIIRMYTPTPKQVEAHLSPFRNLLYGGRAGTGKSHWLRMDAYIRCLSVPGYRALLLRRQLTELRDTHLDKAALEADLLGAKWRAVEYTVVFSNGSRLRFGHCEDNKAIKHYLSSEFDWIGFDEGATFDDYQVRYIGSRLRTTKPGVTPVIRIGSNPGALWLYRYYILRDITVDEDPSYTPDHYGFIPATITDNPHVNVEEQNLRLAGLPNEALRRMYAEGDWDAVEGQEFVEWHRKDPETGLPWHVIHELPMVLDAGVWKTIDTVSWIPYVRVIDWGYSPDEGACIWYACLPGDRYIAVREWTFKETIAEEVAEEIAEQSQGLKIRMSIGGHDMWIKSRETGQAMAETFARKGVSLLVASTARVAGWQRLHAMLKTLVDDGERMVPQLTIYEPGCPALARTIPMLQQDPATPGDVIQKKDHWADTARWFAMSRPSPSKRPTTFKRLSEEARKRLMALSRRKPLGSESVRR